jgi:heme exporter protein C
MRNPTLYLFAAISAGLLSWDLYKVFLVLPDELNQGMIYRIIYFHVPAAMVAFAAFFASLVASAGYLTTKEMRYDSFSASAIEVGFVFATVNLVTGSIWGRIIWGIWWTWDARLTSMFVCWLLYAAYLLLRRAVDEPAQRARLSAVLSIFAFTDVVIVWKSIEWWRTQHPGPVLSIRGGGGMAPGMQAPLYWNALALALLATILLVLRMRQEAARREIDALRRQAYAL